MRRRQLRSALLHGSRRTWREHKRAWPPVAVGFVVVAVIIAGMAVKDALDVTKQNQQEKELQRQEQVEQQKERQQEQGQQKEQQSSAPKSPNTVPTSPISPSPE